MKFLNNIKTKLQQVKDNRKVPVVSDIPQEDIYILSSMCMRCIPAVEVLKFKLFPMRYSYYVPTTETEADIAKSIFEKHGIQMEVHYSRILSYEGQNVLRTNLAKYERTNQSKQVRNIMKAIEDGNLFLYSPQGQQKRQDLSLKISELQQQNQK